MDNFRVLLLSQALKFYRSCPVELARRLNKCFEDLEKNPFFGAHIKLLKTTKRKRLYRYRIGILLISPRPPAYRNI